MTNVHLPHVKKRVEFLYVDLRPYGDQEYRFCNSPMFTADKMSAEATLWGGFSWTFRPFESTGWKTGDSVERPKVVLPDPNAALSIKLRQLDGASGANIIRYQALGESILKGENVPISIEQYKINQVQDVPGVQVEIELATIFDYRDLKSPSFIMTREDYPGLGSNLTR